MEDLKDIEEELAKVTGHSVAEHVVKYVAGKVDWKRIGAHEFTVADEVSSINVPSSSLKSSYKAKYLLSLLLLGGVFWL